MLEIRQSNINIFKKVIDSLKYFTPYAAFECSKHGIQLQARDITDVSLVSLTLRSDGFDKFRCDRNLSMGINLAEMVKILKCANNDDTLTMKAQDNAKTVTFMFVSPNRDKISLYEMELLNLDIDDDDNLGIPETSYACIVRMPSMEFARICNNLAQFGETILISCSSQEIDFFIRDDNSRRRAAVNLYVDQENGLSIDSNENGTVNVLFSVRFLASFTKPSPISTEVKLGISNDCPLLVEYHIENYGHLRYYLAPRT